MSSRGQLARGGGLPRWQLAVHARSHAASHLTLPPPPPLPAAHEQREVARRQEEHEKAQIQRWAASPCVQSTPNNSCTGRQQPTARVRSRRYYAQQKATDAISANMAKDELRRQGREAAQQHAAQQLAESTHKVRRAVPRAALVLVDHGGLHGRVTVRTCPAGCRHSWNESWRPRQLPSLRRWQWR